MLYCCHHVHSRGGHMVRWQLKEHPVRAAHAHQELLWALAHLRRWSGRRRRPEGRLLNAHLGVRVLQVCRVLNVVEPAVDHRRGCRIAGQCNIHVERDVTLCGRTSMPEQATCFQGTRRIHSHQRTRFTCWSICCCVNDDTTGCAAANTAKSATAMAWPAR